jgi:hypothetical protein
MLFSRAIKTQIATAKERDKESEIRVIPKETPMH